MGYMCAFADSGQNVISRMFRMRFSNFTMRRLIHLLAWTWKTWIYESESIGRRRLGSLTIGQGGDGGYGVSVIEHRIHNNKYRAGGLYR